MKNIKINNLTIYFLLILLLSGYIKLGIIIFSIVLFHELGHILVIKYFKYKIISINIYPFGGITLVDKDLNTRNSHEFLISIGGILNQLILFIIVYLLPLDESTKILFYKYNISILLFNLIPIIPLDGSIILRCIFNKIFSFKKSLILSIITSIVGIFIYVLFNYKYNLNNYLIIMLFVYKIYEYIKNYKYIMNRFLLERYLNKYDYKYISTKRGDIGILKLDTYQYFIKDNDIVSEREILNNMFR